MDSAVAPDLRVRSNQPEPGSGSTAKNKERREGERRCFEEKQGLIRRIFFVFLAFISTAVGRLRLFRLP
jgi:hypothetical protein